MKNLLVDTFIKIVRHCTHEHSLCEIADFGSRDKAVHLCGDRRRLIVTVNGHGLPLLQNPTKAFGKRLGSFSHYLPAEHISYCILNYFALLISIVSCKLREVLKAQTYRYLVASGCGNKIIQATKVNRRQLVDDN